jgi:hAT family C-terminal dimerisation region
MIAVKLFSMAASTASSERNFSTMAFVHSKLRNSLNKKTVEKLVFIKSNLPAIYDYQQVEDRESSDSECCDTDHADSNSIDRDD